MKISCSTRSSKYLTIIVSFILETGYQNIAEKPGEQQETQIVYQFRQFFIG